MTCILDIWESTCRNSGTPLVGEKTGIRGGWLWRNARDDFGLGGWFGIATRETWCNGEMRYLAVWKTGSGELLGQTVLNQCVAPSVCRVVLCCVQEKRRALQRVYLWDNVAMGKEAKERWLGSELLAIVIW